ncbi:unnamed protein product [Linum tenue]|uniref:Uncharacterized protein n=1 Tax=Linum tenue TaxID=586396 RepID=A0AAV0LYB4_9ROSI|nr:unnamed protein product [Linum tenue]
MSSPTFSLSCQPSTPSEPPSSADAGRISGLGFRISISTTAWFTSHCPGTSPSTTCHRMNSGCLWRIERGSSWNSPASSTRF